MRQGGICNTAAGDTGMLLPEARLQGLRNFLDPRWHVALAFDDPALQDGWNLQPVPRCCQQQVTNQHLRT